MSNYASMTDEEFQSICNQLISYLNNKTQEEPDWREISYLLEHNKYDEILEGLVCYYLDIELLATDEFNDDFLSEYLDEGEEIDDEKRISFAHERISRCFEDFSGTTFSIHSVEIKNEKGQCAIIGFSVSGPGGQYGFDIDCLGVFRNQKELLEGYSNKHYEDGDAISDEKILSLWVSA